MFLNVTLQFFLNNATIKLVEMSWVTTITTSCERFHITHKVCSVGWFVSLLVREEVLLTDLCERKILFQLEIYDRLRQATAK